MAAEVGAGKTDVTKDAPARRATRSLARRRRAPPRRGRVVSASGRNSTDDAQIDGHITQVSTQVGGTIVASNIKENQHVDAGSVLAEIDPRDYQWRSIARRRTRMRRRILPRAKTGILISAVSIERRPNASGGSSRRRRAWRWPSGRWRGARGADGAERAAARERGHRRQDGATSSGWKALVAKDEIAAARRDGVAGRCRARVGRCGGRTSPPRRRPSAPPSTASSAPRPSPGGASGVEDAPEQLEVTVRADGRGARAAGRGARPGPAHLERTTIRAPTAGTISRKSIESGQVVQPGQPLLAIVSDAEVWVTANFKETQLKDMRVGQSASVDVDALGGREFRGRVESIAAATGAKFSLLPPENATGNYVKVVQRVPVKIVLEPGQDPERRLRPGMSVQPTVFLT